MGSAVDVLDCRGYLCPIPVIKTEEKIGNLRVGETVVVYFTDPGAKEDLMAWSDAHGHTYFGFENNKKIYQISIKKGS